MYRIYSTCSIHTATGRITMHEPNLQTIRKDFSLELEGKHTVIIHVDDSSFKCVLIMWTAERSLVFIMMQAKRCTKLLPID